MVSFFHGLSMTHTDRSASEWPALLKLAASGDASVLPWVMSNLWPFILLCNEFMIGCSLTILLSHAQSRQASGISTIIRSRDSHYLDLIMTLVLGIKMNCMRVFCMYMFVFILMNACRARKVDSVTLTPEEPWSSDSWSGHLIIICFYRYCY